MEKTFLSNFRAAGSLRDNTQVSRGMGGVGTDNKSKRVITMKAHNKDFKYWQIINFSVFGTIIFGMVVYYIIDFLSK